jgi:post-segregation antitoxin (ccd killing protein)
MAALQVKNVPDDLHEELREVAAQRGCTISDLVLTAIRKELRRPRMAAWLDTVSAMPRVDVTNKEILDAIDDGRRGR